jgi:hypothetical protein
MRLALGDVLRDRTDLALGTFIGVARRPSGTLVALHVPGAAVRLRDPRDVEVVARYSGPTTFRHGVVALAVLVIAGTAAYLACHSAQELGAHWGLTSLAGLGAYSAVMATHRWWLRLTGPRRFRV